MAKIFVDTVAWIAILNKNDALHTTAQRLMQDLQRRRVQLVTSVFVLIEVADGLASPQLRRKMYLHPTTTSSKQGFAGCYRLIANTKR